MTFKVTSYTPYLVFALLVFGLLSCADEPRQTVEPKKVTEKGSRPESNEFQLEDHGIKIELPNGYVRYSAVQYQNKLQSIYKNKRLDYELSRLRQLRDMDGKLYIFYNESTNSAFTINAAPLMEMSGNNPKDLLEMVRSNHEEASKASNHKYEKITAKYSDRAENQVFKAVYKITGRNIEEPIFAHSYIISRENTTLYISATSVGEFDYDPYIESINF